MKTVARVDIWFVISAHGWSNRESIILLFSIGKEETERFVMSLTQIFRRLAKASKRATIDANTATTITSAL